METTPVRPSSPAVTLRHATLLAIGAVLEETEREEGLIPARRLAAALDYDLLTRLARRGLAGEPANHPEHIPRRFLLLLGMRGARVRDFQEALVSLGHPVRISGVYDDATYRAYWSWLAEVGRV